MTGRIRDILHVTRTSLAFAKDLPTYIQAVGLREAAKKIIFFSGPAT